MDNSIFKFKTNLIKRIYATIIDYGLFFLFIIVYTMYFGYENEEGGKSVNGLLALPIFIVWLFYFIVIEAYYGATLGHQGFYLRVLSLNRKKIGFKQALKRHLLDPIDFFYGIPAIIVIKNSDRHQRIGDLWARTFVVDMTDSEQYLEKQNIMKRL